MSIASTKNTLHPELLDTATYPISLKGSSILSPGTPPTGGGEWTIRSKRLPCWLKIQYTTLLFNWHVVNLLRIYFSISSRVFSIWVILLKYVQCEMLLLGFRFAFMKSPVDYGTMFCSSDLVTFLLIFNIWISVPKTFAPFTHCAFAWAFLTSCLY